MDNAQVAQLAALIRETYSPSALDTGVTEPTIVESPEGSRAVVLPRSQMEEPLRSLQLIDAAAVGSTLVVTFTWDDGTGDDTVYLMPLDTRDLDMNLSDNIAVTSFLVQHVEHTLAGPRESWEAARSTPISRRLAVVRPWTAT
ncbi:hypothetical protein [Pseudonocardia sp. MH-G8]|uniref:hypothetical protein n=1 Tax=Pseudonocardia sp. MH-G8 TaxID=1854588 RepID=UPI000BA155AE|nr:hypothetical protein [Pseudonocardia sp. MH-G8]OZM79652.1 hypothetical protein CFP66_24070 [Pseudonocardia sp. MH-G8]